jgi:glutamine synthetase
MKYSKEEVIQYVKEEDVKFIRLAFCDVFGKQKNIAIMPEELPRAFEYGISFDASAIAGFGDELHSDLFLHPEPETLVPLPWRPEHGRVVQMFSGITHPNGTPFDGDTRNLLKQAMSQAEQANLTFTFGAEQEFYLFNLDEDGKPTHIPSDEAGYMDIAPEDRGENIRREICLTLEQMGIRPESSHHEEGPGQNEIDFRFAEALLAADHALTFQRVVRTVAHRNGLTADFSPKPLDKLPGNSMHVNMSIESKDGRDRTPDIIAGICIPRCSPISTKDQCDMDRCIARAKETGATPYRKGTA